MGSIRRPTYTTTDPDTGEKVTKTQRVWWIRYYRNGRRHEESSGSTKKGDAARLLKLREGDVAKGLPVSAKIGRLRFDEAAADVVADYQANGRATTEDVQRRIELHLEPFFGGRRMAAITTDAVRAYTTQRLDAGAKHATVNRELAVLKRAFRLAEQSGAVLHRPHIPMLKENNVRQGFFERQDFEDVRAALPDYMQGPITLMYWTGWRRGDVLPLEWSQVDREGESIRLEPGTTKNDEGRTLPYGKLPELVDVIEDAWAHREKLAKAGTISPYVFTMKGKQIAHSVWYRNWRNACAEAEVRGKLPHDLRRTAVRNLTRAGVPQAVAMQITGHKTTSVFQRYDIVSEQDISEGLGKLHADAAGKEKGRLARRGRVADFPSD